MSVGQKEKGAEESELRDGVIGRVDGLRKEGGRERGREGRE